MNHFKDLPIIFVDNWDDLELEYLLDQYKKVKQNGREKLRFEYWEEKIKERT